jgi:hypothetical protein
MVPMPIRSAVALLVLVLTLAACAPASGLGNRITEPLDADDFTVEVVAGQEWYVQTSRNPGSLGLKITDTGDLLNDQVDNPRVGQTYDARLFGLRLIDIDAPEGWRVTLARAEVEREILDVDRDGRDIYYTYSDTVRIILSISVPEGAGGSTKTITALAELDGESTPVLFVVSVSAPEM